MRHPKDSHHVRGNQVRGNKLSENDVREIRIAVRDGEQRKVVAERYGISISQVFRIVHGYAWQYLGDVE